MKSSLPNLIVAAVCAVMFGLILILVRSYPPHAKRLFFIVSWLGLFLSAILAVNELKFKKRAGEDKRTGADKYRVTRKTFLKTSAWIVGIFPLVYLVGFTVGISSYVLVFYKMHGGRWLTSIMLGVIMVVIVYLGFVVGLKIRFPVPPLFPFLRW